MLIKSLKSKLMKSFYLITRIFAITIVIVIISSCKATRDTRELVTIDVKKAYNEPLREMMLSEIVKDIEYVKLETSPACLIGGPVGFVSSEHYAVVYDGISKRVLLFNKEGKYLKDIGSIGRGPEEYINLEPGSLQISPDEKYIIFKDYVNGFMIYKIDGSFFKKCDIPSAVYDGHRYLNPEKFVAYRQWFNLPEKGGNQVLIYDKEMNLTDSLIFSYPDTMLNMRMYMAFDNFSIFKENIYLRRKLNDTIFQIDQANSITPHLVVDFGDLKMPSLLVSRAEMESKYLQLYNFRRINNYYFFRMKGCSRTAPPGPLNYDFLVYNKITGETFLLDNHPDPYYKDKQNSRMLINDMDGMIDPPILWYLSRNKFNDYLDIIEAKAYLESGAVDQEKLVTDKYYKELSKLLAKSDIEDNPIIRIFHLW